MRKKEERKVIISFLLVLLIASISDVGIVLAYLWMVWFICKAT